MSFSNPLAGNTHHQPTFLEVDVKVNTTFSDDLISPKKTTPSTRQHTRSVLMPQSPLSLQGAHTTRDRRAAIVGRGRPGHTKTVSVR